MASNNAGTSGGGGGGDQSTLNGLLSSLPQQQRSIPNTTTSIQQQLRNNAFDNYTRGIRGNVVSGAVDALDTISNCDSIMWVNSLLTYVLTVVVILLLICVSFNFNNAFTIILAAVATIITVYQSIMLSTKSCSSIFNSILG